MKAFKFLNLIAEGVVSAISFLTLIPIRKEQKITPTTIIFFPLIGLLLGGSLVLLNFILTKVFCFNAYLTAGLLLAGYIALTGGLHLDGLSDTVDGLVGGRGDREKTLLIMDETHIGAMGVIAIGCNILIKFILLTNLPQCALLVFPCVSRWAMVLSMRTSRPAKMVGLGKLCIENTTLSSFIVATVICVVITLIALPVDIALLGIIISGLVAYKLTKSFTRRLGGMTGDAIGAINEIVENIMLICVVWLWGIV